MAERRKYELGKRAEQVEETRRRIVEATVALHLTAGPAATEVTEVARRAGIRRPTVYKHFPDGAALLGACSAHWRTLHPAPDIAAWAALPDPAERLRTGIRELYGWYRETEPMTANVLRDAERLPALREIVETGLGRYLAAVRAELGRGRPRRRAVRAAVAAAADFHLWRVLARAGLGDAEAADLAARLVELA
jgi:AcrR family transcriptional regulator